MLIIRLQLEGINQQRSGYGCWQIRQCWYHGGIPVWCSRTCREIVKVVNDAMLFLKIVHICPKDDGDSYPRSIFFLQFFQDKMLLQVLVRLWRQLDKPEIFFLIYQTVQNYRCVATNNSACNGKDNQICRKLKKWVLKVRKFWEDWPMLPEGIDIDKGTIMKNRPEWKRNTPAICQHNFASKLPVWNLIQRQYVCERWIISLRNPSKSFQEKPD